MEEPDEGARRREVAERRIVEIAYALVTGAALVGLPLLVGWWLHWSGQPLFGAVVVVLGVFTLLRVVVILVRFEARLQHELKEPPTTG